MMCVCKNISTIHTDACRVWGGFFPPNDEMMDLRRPYLSLTFCCDDLKKSAFVWNHRTVRADARLKLKHLNKNVKISSLKLPVLVSWRTHEIEIIKRSKHYKIFAYKQ